MKKRETILKERVLADLKTLLPHVWVFKTNEVAVRGILDIIICARGFFIAIELKSASTKDPDELQRYNLVKIEKAGGIALTACPETWPLIFMKVAQIAKE